jgi:mRNA-degrading endonuclease RelE of RelBE toxin-antitoxin system
MPFQIILAPEAAADLRRLKVNVRAAVRQAIGRHLRHEPTRISKSRIKRLRALNRPQFRLRVGDIRVYHDVVEQEVRVLAVVPKSGSAEWLKGWSEEV